MEHDGNVNEVYEVITSIDDQGRKIINDYCFIETLGQGTFSKVKKVIHLMKNEEYAVKIINERLMQKKKKIFDRDSEGNIIMNCYLQDQLREIAILKKISHKNVIRLYEIVHYVEKGKILMISEIANYGPIMKYDVSTGDFKLNQNLMEEGESFYSEDQIRKFFKDILNGLDYLHANGIVHRDIKPDNVLVTKHGTCKITDFNVSAMFEKSDIVQKTEGTIFFYAPEMCNGASSFSGKPLDIWALGVTLFILTFNRLPIKTKNEDDMIELLNLISKAEIIFPESETRTISKELKDLFLSLFEIDPEKRITTVQIKKHPWVSKDNTDFSDDEYKIIEVTKEEINNSMKFFHTLLKIKSIFKVFRDNASIKQVIPRIKKSEELESQNLNKEKNDHILHEVLDDEKVNIEEVKLEDNQDNEKLEKISVAEVKEEIIKDNIENDLVQVEDNITNEIDPEKDKLTPNIQKNSLEISTVNLNEIKNDEKVKQIYSTNCEILNSNSDAQEELIDEVHNEKKVIQEKTVRQEYTNIKIDLSTPKDVEEEIDIKDYEKIERDPFIIGQEINKDTKEMPENSGKTEKDSLPEKLAQRSDNYEELNSDTLANKPSNKKKIESSIETKDFAQKLDKEEKPSNNKISIPDEESRRCCILF